jgi:hypothetical protein
MKEITVTKPFTYYINGYEKRDFTIGKHSVPYDCASYAENGGFTKAEVKEEGVKKDDGADKSVRSKKTSAS